MIPSVERVKAHFVRARVWNTGNKPALDVEVFAENIREIDERGIVRSPVPSFVPMNLVWSHTRQIYCPRINPGMYKYCDLFHVIDPEDRLIFEEEELSLDGGRLSGFPRDKTILVFDVHFPQTSLSHLVPAGRYGLNVSVAASNAAAVNFDFEIGLSGEWYSDEKTMYSKGLTVKCSSGFWLIPRYKNQ